MTSNIETGTTTVDLDGTPYLLQYEVAEIRDGWFTLTIWYMGKSCAERVPSYSMNPHDDIKATHGSMLLRRLISEPGQFQ
jgi:hypothetical protein